MKINPYQNNVNVNAYKQISQSHDTAQPTPDSTSSVKKDQVTISSEAKQLNETNRVQLDRQQKVEDIKNQVQNNQYQIQPQKVAEAFASYWQTLGSK